MHQDRLYFNCLGHHRISSCNLKQRCHHCRCKQHTSLCALGHQSNLNPPTTPVNAVQQQSNTTALPPSPVQLQPASVRDLSIYWSTSYKLCSTSTHSSTSSCCSTYWCTLYCDLPSQTQQCLLSQNGCSKSDK